LVRLITGNRVKVPPSGFPGSGKNIEIELTHSPERISANMVVMATGQKPNSGLLDELEKSSGIPLVNRDNGCISVKPTLQLQSDHFPNIFSLGDVANTGSHKAARPGAQQAGVVARNIVSLIRDGKAAEEFVATPPGIHLSLGLVGHGYILPPPAF
jgi:NADH dehydrogenase FAD-containing subunit